MSATPDYFIAPAIFPDHGIRTMADRGMRLFFDTGEVTPEIMTTVFRMKGRSGFVIFAASAINPEELDIPDITQDFKGEKTPSQRLRAVIYRLWEQSNTGLDFEVYYRSNMDSIINQLKDKLAWI